MLTTSSRHIPIYKIKHYRYSFHSVGCYFYSSVTYNSDLTCQSIMVSHFTKCNLCNLLCLILFITYEMSPGFMKVLGEVHLGYIIGIWKSCSTQTLLYCEGNENDREGTTGTKLKKVYSSPVKLTFVK